MDEISNNLNRLKNLLPILLDTHPILTCEKVEYKTDTGVCTGFNLFNTDKVAVQNVFIPKNMKFADHQHSLIDEYLIVYIGKLDIYFNDVFVTTLIAGNGIHIPKNNKHFIIAQEDTSVIEITISSNGEYSK